MKRLLLVTQKVNENDDLLGFFVDWIREFAGHFQRVDVIAIGAWPTNLPANVCVYSLGKERNTLRIIRWLRFALSSLRLLPKCDSVFVHMSPVFAVLIGPWARLLKKKLFLWYLHRSLTWKLRLADKFVTKIFTASADSLALKSHKIAAVGHGINASRFHAERSQEKITPLRILSVGRLSPIKDFATLIRATALLRDRGYRVNVRIVGRPVVNYDQEYRMQLITLVQKLKLDQHIQFVGFIPFSRIAPYYQSADILVNLAPTGGIDKTVLEGMASGCLVLVANRAFQECFGDDARNLIFETGNADDLANKLTSLAVLTNEERSRLREKLISEVHVHHVLAATIRRMLAIMS